MWYQEGDDNRKSALENFAFNLSALQAGRVKSNKNVTEGRRFPQIEMLL
jgi:hypothetical protein